MLVLNIILNIYIKSYTNLILLKNYLFKELKKEVY